MNTDTGEVQRRTLLVLTAAQILSGGGLAAGVTVGALLTQDMLHSTSLAGFSGAIGTAGSAVAAVAIGHISQSRGRRPGLTAGYLAGAVGSAGVVAAAVVGNPLLLLSALFVYGAGTATNLQARYAGADLAVPAHRARAVSTVLVATTLGGVIGPNVAAPSGVLAHALGLPRLTGLFLVAGAVYALAALVLAVWLRPDPLLLARRVGDAPAKPRDETGPGGRSGAVAGTLVMVLTQLVMVAIMTMTPVHMRDHGHGTAATGLVIAVHVGAMYLPSPLSGRLVDRFGHVTVAVAAGLTLLSAGIVAAGAPGGSVVAMVAALALLGLGWNFGLVAGTAILTESVPLATRARTQGLADVCIAVSGAFGGLTSGVVVAEAGYPLLAISGGVAALGVLPAVLVTLAGRAGTGCARASGR